MEVDEIKNASEHSVLFALSNSIDSFVALYLLKKQGFKVSAISIKTWQKGKVGFTKEVKGEDDQFVELVPPRCFDENINALKEFCDKIQVPFYATDASEEFKSRILEHTLDNKLLGKYTNTCFECTRFKLSLLKSKADQLEIDFISTGHYAKVFKNHSSNEYFVYRGNDRANDQSFKLASLTQDVLSRLILPLAEVNREEVKKISKTFSIYDEEVKKVSIKDSVCFQHDPNLSQYVHESYHPAFHILGEVVDAKTQKKVEDHNGLHFYQEGEKGITLKGNTKSDNMVIDIGEHSKKVYIDKEMPKYSGFHLHSSYLTYELDRSKHIESFAKFIYKDDLFNVKIFLKNNNNLYILLDQEVDDLIYNSVVVFYSSNLANARIMGHGFIGKKGELVQVSRVKEFESDKDEEDTQTYTRF